MKITIANPMLRIKEKDKKEIEKMIKEAIRKSIDKFITEVR